MITVLMPVYNGEKYLIEAMDSILNQTFEDFEFLIINDGSRDKSEEIVRSFQDKRIRIVNNERNLGLSESLNKGVTLSKAPYIARQDCDDVSDSRRLELQIEAIKRDSFLGLLGTKYTHINAKSEKYDEVKVLLNDDEIKAALPQHNCFAHGSVMFPRRIGLELGGFRKKCFATEDYDLWLRISEKYKVSNLRDNLYFLRRGTETLSTNNLKKQILYHLLVSQLAKERLCIGNDSLDKLKLSNRDELQKCLENYYHMSRNEVNNFIAHYYNDFYLQSLHSHNLPLALEYWFKAFCHQPQKWKIRKLFKKLWEIYIIKT